MVHRYSGTEGVYSPVFKNEKSPTCPMCSPGLPLSVDADSTLQEVRLMDPVPHNLLDGMPKPVGIAGNQDKSQTLLSK